MGNQLGAVRSGKFDRERDMRQAVDLAHALTEAERRVAVPPAAVVLAERRSARRVGYVSLQVSEWIIVGAVAVVVGGRQCMRDGSAGFLSEPGLQLRGGSSG